MQVRVSFISGVGAQPESSMRSGRMVAGAVLSGRAIATRDFFPGRPGAQPIPWRQLLATLV